MYNKGDFSNYLLTYKVEKGCEFTHTSIIKPSGAFYIPSDQIDQFYATYTHAMCNGEELYVTERHKSVGPMVIDLDFRFPKPEKSMSRVYTKDTIMDILKIYAESMSAYFDFSQGQMKPVFYVMEKPYPTIDKELMKDGLHIVVSNVISKCSVQFLIRNKVLPQMKIVLASLGVINQVDDVVDEAVIQRNNWQMYGSKKPNCEAYKVTYAFAYDHMNDTFEEYSIESEKELVEILSIRNKYEETSLKIEKVPEVQEFERKQQEEKKKMIDTRLSKLNTKKNTCDNLDFVAKLVDILSISRAEKYDDWIRLGWCLRNIDHRLVDVWVGFSKRSSKYTDGECERLWNHMRDDGLGIGTLHMWAKQDDKAAYDKLLESDLFSLINTSCSKAHNDIAKVVHFMYKYDFVCVSIKHNYWYEFKNHRWVPCDCGHTLRAHLSNEVSKKYCAVAANFISKAATEDDTDAQDRYRDKGKKLLEVANKLKDGPFKDNIIRECREMFYFEKFEEKLDSRCHLIGFENGVYDLEAMEFREGRPEDFVSFSTLTNYIEYDNNHPYVEELKGFLSQVFTKPEIREYVLTVMASFLNGNIKEERFNIWTGSGANGKSKIIELFESAFGEYCMKFPITLLTGKRAASNAATSEIARAKGKRFACLQEPSEDEKLNVGLMKELSGGDKIQARALFKEPIEFKPQFKMILTCNHLPNVPSDDGGTWRRIRVVEFTSKFTENPNPDKANEFPINTNIQTRFEDWKEHFMALLLQYYAKYLEYGIEEPDDVLKCTKEYQRNNDNYLEFLEQEVEKDPRERGFLCVNEAYSKFKQWIKENAPHLKDPSKRGFVAALEKTLGKCVNAHKMNGWKGYKLKDDDADDEGLDDFNM
jgi:P4 family phage/plasmid primase-like protien